MKKIFISALCGLILCCSSLLVFADEAAILEEQRIQSKIDNIGLKILNANKITKRVIFTYSLKNKPFIPNASGISKRQIICYANSYKYAQNDDEIAAMLAREISLAVRSYDGPWGGLIDSAQIKMAPKKYELFADKRAVDYMVYAGFNPIGLITYINKSAPQKHYDIISCSNLTSKRLAAIYEYVFTKYPQYLVNNEYLHTEAYQNFLLNSIENRVKLEKKIKSGSQETVRYE